VLLASEAFPASRQIGRLNQGNRENTWRGVSSCRKTRKAAVMGSVKVVWGRWRWRHKVLRNVGILPHHYTASQPGRPPLEYHHHHHHHHRGSNCTFHLFDGCSWHLLPFGLYRYSSFGVRLWAPTSKCSALSFDARLQVFTALKSVVFWVITPCSDVVGYQQFRGSHCLQLPGSGQEIPAFYRTQRSNTTFPRAHHWSLSGISAVHSTLSQSNP
jgi:hypothetical protein